MPVYFVTLAKCSVERFMLLAGLEKFADYSVVIAASTVNGTGPSSEAVVVKTDESG